MSTTNSAKGDGVNIFEFERLFKINIVKLSQDKAPDFYKLIDIPDKNKPNIFKKELREQDVRLICDNLINNIKESVGSNKIILTSSDNNREGADFFENITKTHIEIKLGSATDLNIGFRAASNIFGHGLISLLPQLNDRKRWRGIYDGTDESKELIKSLHTDKLKTFATAFNSYSEQY